MSEKTGRGPAILLTNMPSPYRGPVFDLVAKALPGFKVIYCRNIEPDRQWHLPDYRHERIVLNSATLNLNGRFVHLGLNIIPHLMRLNPEVVITSQYYPAAIAAFAYAKIARVPHVCMYDGWEGFDRHLSGYHKILRRMFYRNSDAFIGVSSHTRRLFESYGVEVEGRYFWSPLCVDNDLFFKTTSHEREYHLMLSGRMVDTKLPEFTLEVILGLRARIPNLKLLLIGSGDRLEFMLKRIRAMGVAAEYPGFVQQQDLPRYYAMARILLFPTKGDCWGLVANEAMAMGTPVLTSHFAGAKEDLVRHGENGYILPIEPGAWTEHAMKLLGDDGLWNTFSARAKEAVVPFHFHNAAKGIVDAVHYCRSLNR